MSDIREPCPMCSRPIHSVRLAVSETDLPADTGSADAILQLWSRMTAGEATIDMLREALAESKRETQEARAAAADLEPWLWSDDDTAKTVEGMSNLMTVRITGGHLRALIAGAVKADSP